MKYRMFQLPPTRIMTSVEINDFVRSIPLPDDKNVLFVIDDPTRPPNLIAQIVIDYFIDSLPEGAVKVLVASGMHRQPTMEEITNHIGKNIVEKVPVYRHNPFVSLRRYNSDHFFMENYVISIGTTLPHTFMGLSGAGKIFSPGLDDFDGVNKFHSLSKQGRLESVIMNWHHADYCVNVTINKFGQPILVFGSPKHLWSRKNLLDYWDNARSAYEIKLPKPTNVSVLIPWYKNTDLMQCLNAITVCRNKPVVHRGGILCFDCSQVKDGIGVHYMFQPFNGKRSVQYDLVWDILDGLQLAFITKDIPKVAIQELFRRKVLVFNTIEDFERKVDQEFGHGCPVNIYQGADIMIGV